MSAETLPAAGGVYEKDAGGKLKQVQEPTKAPDHPDHENAHETPAPDADGQE